MSKGPLHKLPHTVHLPCCYDEILRLLLLQHQPHSLKETDTETKTERSNYWEIIKTVRWSTLDRAKLSPDRQEVNLRPLSGAFAHTSALTSLQGLRGHILWERRTEHSHRPTVLLAHKNAHVAMNTRAFRLTALHNWHTLTTKRYFKTHKVKVKKLMKFHKYKWIFQNLISWLVFTIPNYTVQATLLLA